MVTGKQLQTTKLNRKNKKEMETDACRNNPDRRFVEVENIHVNVNTNVERLAERRCAEIHGFLYFGLAAPSWSTPSSAAETY